MFKGYFLSLAKAIPFRWGFGQGEGFSGERPRELYLQVLSMLACDHVKFQFL